MSWDFAKLLDELEPPDQRRGPSLRAIERGKGELMSEEERQASEAYEAQPAQRSEHRRAIESQRDPQRRKILEEAYEADSLRFGEKPIDVSRSERIGQVRGAGGEKSDEELFAEIMGKYGVKAQPKEEGFITDLQAGLQRGMEVVTNFLRPRGAADLARQQQRIETAGERSFEIGGGPLQRGVTVNVEGAAKYQRQQLEAAAEAGPRLAVSRMRFENIEADREGKPRPHREEKIRDLERRMLPVNALSMVERRVREEAERANEIAATDFVRNVVASVRATPAMYQSVYAGFLQAFGHARSVEADAISAVTGEDPEGLRALGERAIEEGKALQTAASTEEKRIFEGLRPGIGAQAVGGAVQSMAFMGPALAGGLLTKSVPVVISWMGTQTAAKAFAEGTEEGLNYGQAATYSVLQGLIEAGTEYSPMKALFAGAKQGTLKWFLNFLSKEVGQEVLATGLGNAVDKVSVRPEMTAEDYAHDLLVTILSTPIAAGAQAGAVRALRGRELDEGERREEILRKFRDGLSEFQQVTREAERAADRERGARGPATHRLEDGTPVRPRVEAGEPVRGVWETDQGELVEAERAEPVKKAEPNAEWTVNGVVYDVEVTGPGQEENTARLADGQEVPLTEFASLGDEAKARLGLEEELARAKPAAPKRPSGEAVPVEPELPPPPGSRRQEAARPPQAAPPPQEAPTEPGAELASGFKAGPEPGSKYRVSRVPAAGGAVMLEKRSPEGAVSSFYVGKDGQLIDASTVQFNKPETMKRLWKTLDEEAAGEVKGVLDAMGKLYLRDPARQDLKARLKDLVSKPRKPPSAETLEKMRQARARRAAVDVDRDSILPAIMKLGGINFEERLDITGDTKMNRQLPFGPYLFNSQGASLDGMAEKLAELGYLTEDERSDLNVLSERIKDELGGLAKHWSLRRSEAAMGAEEKAEAERTQAPEEDLAREIERQAGDVPIWGDIEPEEMPLEGLEIEARDMAIAELLSQLDENTVERLTMQYEGASEESFLAALRKEVKDVDEGKDVGAGEGREARQIPPPEYRVTREAEGVPEGEAAAPARKGLKALAPREIDEGAPIAQKWQDVRWQETLDYYAADINGRRALILKPIADVRPYQVIVSGSMTQLTNNGRADTFEEAKRLAFDEYERQPDVHVEKKGRGDRARRLEQPRALYSETADVWVARIKQKYGERWLDEAERIVQRLETNLSERPLPRTQFNQVAAEMALDESRFLVNQMRAALYRERTKVEQKGGKYAKEVRGDKGPAEVARRAREKGEEDRRRDLQQAEKARAATRDREALALKAQTEAELKKKEEQAKKAKVRVPLTGPAPPLLTTPAGVAPPREVEKEKVPTQQLKLFQRTVDYAAQQAETPESQAQAEAGNYSKGHWIVGPRTARLDISIETPQGERRRPEWPPLKDHYGYIRGTVGFDKDHLDVFVNPGTRDDFASTVFVVNQVIGSFDEHKVMMGYPDLEIARQAYLRNYEQGWDGLDSIIPISFEAFAKWATTKGGRGPKGGALRLALAKQFEAELPSARALPGAKRAAGVEGAETPQLDLFSATQVPGTPGVLFEKVVVESERIGKIRLATGKINDHVDAAQAFRQLITSPRELFHLIGLNEQNEPIAYYPLFSGTTTQTSVYPREVWLALYQTPGVKKVWMAHNHPSGVAMASQADELLTEQLKSGLSRDLGIEYMGHVILAAGNKAHSIELGTFDLPEIAAQGTEVEIRERTIRIDDPVREVLTSPGAVRDFVRTLKAEKPGILFMDAQHRVIAYYYMTPAEMAKLRTHDLNTGFAKLMRQVGRNNSTAAIAIFPGTPRSLDIERAVQNVGGALSGADVRMLDAFTERGPGNWESFAERGLTTAMTPFYSLSGRPSDMTAQDVQEELTSNPLAQALRGKIVYVDNPYQLPEHILQTLLAQGGIATAGGVWDPTSQDHPIYLVASNIERGNAATVLLHESVGHYGLAQILGEQYVNFMMDVYRSRIGDIQAQARVGPLRLYNFDFRKPEHQMHAAAEWLAHKAERGEEATLWQKFLAWIRFRFRERGWVKEWMDSDILLLLKMSNKVALNGGNVTINGQPAWHLSAPSPIWRSTLQDRIRELGPAKADAANWRKFLTGMMSRGVKPDEIEWSGIREWLDITPERTITKEDVLEFLTDHGVQIGERILGENLAARVAGVDENQQAFLRRERDEIFVRLDAIGWDVTYGTDGAFIGLRQRSTDILYLAPGLRREGIDAKPYEETPDLSGLRPSMRRLQELTPVIGEVDMETTVAQMTRYETWTLPGGRNYRELLLTLPRRLDKDEILPLYAQRTTFMPPHFDVPNLLAHVRFDERTDADGKRVMFVEEWQSDWAQKGREKGFANTLPAGWTMYESGGRWKIADKDKVERGYGDTKEQALQMISRSTVPAAPFVQKTEQWTALLVKRVIRYGAENGFERVAWTTGAQQNQRYNLATHLKELTVDEEPGTVPRRWHIEGIHVRGAKWTAVRNFIDSELADYIGPERAAKVLAGEQNTFRGEDLEVGGHGMREFYDKIVQNVANNVLKKVGGGRVLTVTIPDITKEHRKRYAGEAGPAPLGDQPGFDITPAMRDSALRGLPMFSLRDEMSRLNEQMQALGRRVDQAYRRGQKNAEELDAELAALRERYFSTLEQLEGELEPELEAEEAVDYTTIEEQFRRAYWAFMNGAEGLTNKGDLAGRLRDIVEGQDTAVTYQVRGKAGSDEQLVEAARDAYAAYMARAARRASFSLREPRGIKEVYGAKDGRLLGVAVRRSRTSGIWDVYLADGTNENLFARGQFRREQAASLNEVNRIFNREGLELNVIKPRNIPVPDVSIFDRDWVAPQLDTYLRRAITYFQNRLLLPELYERTLRAEVGPIPEEAKAHREARIAHPRAAGKIADFDHEFTEPIVDLMKANRFTVKDVGLYLYARHAPERNAAIEMINPDNKSGSGITDENATQMMENLRGRLGQGFVAMERIGDLVNQINRFRENLLLEKGLAKMDAVATMQQKYPNYVPLKEMADDEYVQYHQQEVRGGYQVGRLINTAFGRFSEAQAEFILPAMIAQAKGTISAGENAEVLRALLRQVEFAPNPEVWRIQKHVWKPYIDRDTGQVQYAPRPVQIDAQYSARAISVPVNGERVILMLADERLAQAYKTSGLPVGDFSRMIGSITRFYALMATAANPEFVMTNLMRDFQQAVVRISGEQNPALALKVAKDVPGALWGAYAGMRAKGQLTQDAGRWHRWYRRYIEAGGHIAYRGLQDVETQHKEFLVTLADAGIMPEAIGGLTGAQLRAHRAAKVMGMKAFTKLIIDVNGAVENALRLSAFKNAVETGWNEKDAAMLARNVTVDFNLKGEAGTRIGAYYMFFNANIQGTAILFRSVMNHRAIQFLVLMLFLAGMGFDWWNRRMSATEPDGRTVYDNINDAIKERNFILMTPDGEAGVTVPLPFGFNIFYVAGVQTMSVIQGAKSPLDAAGDMFVTAINAFNPLGQSPESRMGMLQLLSPTFFDPFVQAMTNRNWFDRSIAPERPRTAPPQAASATYYAGTTPAYVEAARWMNEITGGNEVRSGWADISPNMIEHWTRSIFGSAGAFYFRVGEFVHGKATGVQPEVREVPFLRRFYYEPKDYELSHRFYENLNKAEISHFEVQRAFEAGDPQRASALQGEFQAERLLYGEAVSVERQIGVLRKEVWRLRKDERLNDDQRTKQIDQLEQRIRQTMMDFNTRFEKRAGP